MHVAADVCHELYIRMYYIYSRMYVYCELSPTMVWFFQVYVIRWLFSEPPLFQPYALGPLVQACLPTYLLEVNVKFNVVYILHAL